jgi:hypothetical protein
MALVIKDRVKESSTTTGTGTYTLAGAEAGHQTFSVIGDGNTTYYAATDGTYWEVGIGTYTASGTTLARTTILSSSNSNNAVNWTAGEKLIFVTQPSSKANYLDAAGNVTGTQFDEYFDLKTASSAPSHTEGRVFYDQTRDSLAYYNSDSTMTVHTGQDSLLRVYNETGSTIAAGTPVYLTGENNAIPTIAPASASGTLAVSYAVGILPTAIANNSTGFVVTGGIVFFDTSTLTAGERIHVGASAGTLQVDAPSYPYFATDVGLCLVSSSSTGCVYVEIEHHAFEVLRVTGNTHFDADVTVDGDLTVNGTQTITNSNNINLTGAFNYFNSGDTIAESGTTFTGSGLDDAIFTGHYKGTASNKTFKVKITTLHTGGDEDFFRWSTDNFTTQSAEIEITGNDQALADNISVKFNATRGHTLNDVWSGTASPVNVDTGIASNRNTGTSGVGYTHVGFYYDVSTNYWTLFDEYSPEPSGVIDPTHASFEYGTLKAGDFIGSLTGNVTGNLTGNVTGNATGSSSKVDAADNVKSTWGNGDDLQIYHDGSHSYISDQGAGDLRILASSSFVVKKADASENMITANADGAVGLSYDSSQKLATTSSGISVTGNVVASGSVALGDWTITEDANGKLSFAHSGTVKMTVDDTGTIAVANDVLTDETF